MPRMNQPNDGRLGNLLLAKLLLIGDGKLGKTFYAALAAKAGFNILYLDGDVGAATIANMVKTGTLTPEEASRIYLLNIADTIDGGSRDTRFVEFMNEFTSSITLRWNDSQQRLATRKDPATDEIWEIKPGQMGQFDLLVMDSWTGYAESVMLWCGRSHGVNVADATTSEMRPVYGSGSLKTAETLQVIRSARCHIIVIAHPDEFSHTTKPEGKKTRDIKETDLIVDWTKMIPKTTSKPQGMLMSKYFTDVAWMELSASGSERRLNFKAKPDRVSGGHFHDTKSVDEYSFANLVQEIGGVLPPKDNPPGWIRIIEATDIPEETEAKATDSLAKPESKPKVLDGTQPKPVSGMSVFMKRPAATPAKTA